jgi:hydrogenase-4 component B
MMYFLLCYILIIIGSGAAGLVAVKNHKKVQTVSAGIIAIASICTLAAVLFLNQSTGGVSGINFPGWQLPFATFTAACDSLSLFFIVPLLILALCGALYGPRYMDEHHADRTHWLFYSLLIAGMIGVLIARNAVLFLLAWEVMSLASYFLVISDHKEESNIKAGWIYFITAHIGTAFLLVLFFTLASISGSFDFSAWASFTFSERQANIIFILALIAFGLKAGFIPFHVWLPLAHPAAPSHVSALMSGIMIKMGIYGILRIMTYLTPYHAWWGFLFIGIGAVSGILGVLFAIGQHNMKKLLAYSSVENIGIIFLGIGLGIIGCVFNAPTIALFGFAGGLLHIVNHSLFKGLLFLGAGAVIRQTGSGELDHLGGLIKSMPRTAALLLIGAIAICGLPFFNGFISEIIIYAGSIQGAILPAQPVVSMSCFVVIVSLALIGGLATACFTKIFGIVFLGEPRTAFAQNKEDVPVSMLLGMGILGGLCILIGLGSPLVFSYLIHPVFLLSNNTVPADAGLLYSLTVTVSILLAGCALLIIGIFLVKKMLDRKKSVISETGTWDCGYATSDPTIQYTASSFTAPVVDFFKRPLAHREDMEQSIAYFPTEKWKFHTSVTDWFLYRLCAPAFQSCDRFFASFRWFQSGKSGQYVLYIAITVLGLIVWKFFL